MRESKEIKKTLKFIFIPLAIFVIPLYYWINNNIEEKELKMNSSYVIGKVSSSNYRGYRNIVKFKYKHMTDIFETSEYNFNGDKPLPIGLPMIIRININNPSSYRLCRDSIVAYNSNSVKYFKKFNGGWSFKIISSN